MKNCFALALTLIMAVVSNAATLAHWTFGDASLGAENGEALPDSDSYTVWREAVADQSGNGNHLTTLNWETAGFNWTDDSFQGDLSMKAAGSDPGAMTWSAQSSPSGVDIETITPTNWTVEAVFKGDDPSTFRTIVGRDGMQVVAGNDALAPFYLSERAGGVLAAQFADNAGNTHQAVSAAGKIVHGTWYHVAAVSDGSMLRVYLGNLDTGAPYQIVATANLSASVDSSLAVGNGSGATWHAGSWSVSRGLYDGGQTDRFFGAVDEVAISDDALEPGSFVCFNSPPVPVPGPRLMEDLGRGVVAVHKGGTDVYVGWRMLGTEPETVAYNVYRDGVKVNADPISDSCNILDTSGSVNSTYSVAAVIDGVEQDHSRPANVWNNFYHDIPLQVPAGGTTPDDWNYSYSPNDASVGDVDGDGEYEIILKWNPNNAKDNAQSGYTGNVILDAYEMDGTLLWRIDLGVNIRAGAHYTQFMVYDLDSDGRAEVVCKTADGTTDADGTILGNPGADYRNSAGRILTGPEYLSAFDGRTGTFIDTVDYVPARGNVSSWGDDYGNRVDRFLACVAYLDGDHPSVVMCRGYYTRSVLAAWDLVDGELVQRWVFDSNTSGNGAFAGQGNHNLSVADVDDDGKDEIIYGSCTIDDDGTGLYSTGLGHGDALHVSDMDPDRPGLEVWMPHESGADGASYRDAATGEVIWHHANSGDVGRGVAAHIDARYPGYQLWSYAQGGVYNTDGTQMSANYSANMMNHLLWWDGDLQREFLNSAGGSGQNPILEKWNGNGSSRLISLYNYPTSYSTGANNGTKANPCLSGDLFGDWREEVMFRSSDNTKLRIFTTTELTSHRIYTLMHDSQYRLAIAWQNTGYNQPPHPSFYIGAGMEPPPVPDIQLVEPDRSIPSSPIGLVTVPGEGSVALDWADNYETNIVGYNVYRSTTSGSGYASIADGLTESAFTDGSTSNDTTYYYVVTAVNTLTNESPYSAEVSALWATPGMVAYWDFADAGAVDGAWMPGNGTRADLDGDGAMDSDDFRISSTDLTGNGNHLTAWTSEWMHWSAASMDGDFSMIFGNEWPASGTDSAFNPELSGVDVEQITPAQWTVEMKFRSTEQGGIQTIVGRDGAYGSFAALYFAMRGTDLAIEYVDMAENRHNLQIAAGLANNTWYHAAATCDGNTLRLWLDGTQIGSMDVSGSADSRLTQGYGTWSVSRGIYNNEHTDRFQGNVDAVAISTMALSPGTFALSAPAAPAGLTAESGDGQVTLHWPPVANALEYSLKRSSVSGGPYTEVGSPTATNFMHAPLSNGTMNYYVVSAINPAGESPVSLEVDAVPSAAVASNEFLIRGHAIAGGTNLMLSVPNNVPGHRYMLEATDTLAPPDWTTLAVQPGTGSNMQFEIPIDPASTHRYFKLDVQRQ